MAQIEIRNLFIEFPAINLKKIALIKYILDLAKFKKNNDEIKRNYSLIDINLKIKEGDRLAIIGKNGAGKSTLLRVLSGVYSPQLGAIKVDGDVRSLLELSFGIDKEASGYENLLLKAELLRLDCKYIKENINEIIKSTELGDKIYLPVKTYSSGMLLKLAFAISTIGEPEILIMDEWLSVGDSSFQIKAEERLSKIITSSSIFIIATHNMQLVKKLCNRAIVLNNGVIIYDGCPEIAIKKYLD
jgi:lipopolysaccharide transport system ATP-binding protein